MSLLKHNKLNHLLQIWPKGTVATSPWLSRQGIRFDLVARYRKSGWVEPVGHGAFQRVGDKVSWCGALYSLQTQLGLSTHVAGKSALALLGKAHFVPLGDRENIVLFSASGERLPAWFLKRDWHVEIRHVVSDLLPPAVASGFTKVKEAGFEYTVSSAERAILEFLYDVPRTGSFEEAQLLFEGLMTLRPDVVSGLLRQCSSIKVKRLFMVLAELFNHPWVPALNLKQVDFGAGKRQLVHGGFLHPKYHITLPDSWKSPEAVI